MWSHVCVCCLAGLTYVVFILEREGELNCVLCGCLPLWFLCVLGPPRLHRWLHTAYVTTYGCGCACYRNPGVFLRCKEVGSAATTDIGPNSRPGTVGPVWGTPLGNVHQKRSLVVLLMWVEASVIGVRMLLPCCCGIAGVHPFSVSSQRWCT